MAEEVKKRIENPGTWELLSDGSIIGVRRRVPIDDSTRSARSDLGNKMRRRLPRPDKCRDRLGCWEVWTVSTGRRWGMEECRPLLREQEQAGHLIINNLGPRAKVGCTSVVVGFGNAIKLITLGYERFERIADETQGESLLNASTRRKKPGTLTRARASNAWST
jgi:hypothetical protein